MSVTHDGQLVKQAILTLQGVGIDYGDHTTNSFQRYVTKGPAFVFHILAI